MNTRQLYINHSTGIVPNRILTNRKKLSGIPIEKDFAGFSKAIYKKLACEYPKFYKMDKLCKLTFLAAEILVKNSGIHADDLRNTALVLSNALSTLDTDIQFTNTLNSIPSPGVFVYTLPNITIGELCIRHGWKGENIFLVESSFKPSILIQQAHLIMENTPTQWIILGWVELDNHEEYQANLWLISEGESENSTILSEAELLFDYENKYYME